MDHGEHSAALLPRRRVSRGLKRSGKTAWQVAVRTWERFDEDNGWLASAAVAFYGLLSLGPMALLITQLAAFFIGPEKAKAVIGERLAMALGPTAAAAVDHLATGLTQGQYQRVGIFSALVIIYAGTRLFTSLQDALNQIWNVRILPARRLGMAAWRMVRQRLLSALLVGGLGALLLVTVFASAALSWVLHHLPGAINNEALWRAGEVLASLLLATLVFGVMYGVMPDAHVPWPHVWTAAALAALLFVIGKVILGWYVGTYGMESADATATALVVVLLWANFSANVFLLGAEFAEVYTEARGGGVVPYVYAARTIQIG